MVTKNVPLLPDDALTESEQQELNSIIDVDLNNQVRQRNAKLKEFNDIRHKNELDVLKNDPDQPPPWNASRYKGLGKFNMPKAYIALTSESEFLCAVARYVRVQPTVRPDLPTAGVRYDLKRDEFVLEYNPNFFHWMYETHGIQGIIFVLKHEMWHIILGHVTGRIRFPFNAWNIATDTIINLMCNNSLNSTSFVPDWAIFPGRAAIDVWGDDPFVKAGKPKTKTAETIESWNPKDDHSSEWYFFELMKNAPDEQKELLFSFDSHEWNVTISSDDDGNDIFNGKGAGVGEFDVDDFKDYISEKARDIVEAAVTEADNSSNGWGSVPADMQIAIRKMISKQVDWKTLLKQFVGKSIRGGRTCSIKKINRKYPYIHPGVKRGYVSKLLCAIDQSGSVGNESVELLFAELRELSRIGDLDVVPFDTRCDEKDIIKWKKGQPTPTQRVYGGGTDFDVPTSFANNPVNRNRWDGLVILTDGQAPCPSSSRMRRAWILTPGCKLNFDVPGETVIEMDNDGKKPFTAWK